MTSKRAGGQQANADFGGMRYISGRAKNIEKSNKDPAKDAKNKKDKDGSGDWLGLNLVVDDGAHRIPEIVKIADQAGIALDSVELRKPTLDDVFLSFTGRRIRDEKGSFLERARRFNILRQARGQTGRR